MPGEAGVSKSQTIKMIILVIVLLVVLVFNGKIKRSISAWRTGATGAAGSADTSAQNGSLPEPDRQGLGQTIGGSLPISEINRILALFGGSKAARTSPLEKGVQAGQGWPDNLERDIFSFQTPGAAPGRAAVEAAEQQGAGLNPFYSSKEGLTKSGGTPRFKLEATLTGGNPVAVINNQPLTIGQSISGYRLREIRDRQAVLTRDGQDIVLELAWEGK